MRGILETRRKKREDYTVRVRQMQWSEKRFFDHKKYFLLFVSKELKVMRAHDSYKS